MRFDWKNSFILKFYGKKSNLESLCVKSFNTKNIRYSCILFKDKHIIEN